MTIEWNLVFFFSPHFKHHNSNHASLKNLKNSNLLSLSPSKCDAQHLCWPDIFSVQAPHTSSQLILEFTLKMLCFIDLVNLRGDIFTFCNPVGRLWLIYTLIFLRPQLLVGFFLHLRNTGSVHLIHPVEIITYFTSGFKAQRCLFLWQWNKPHMGKKKNTLK